MATKSRLFWDEIESVRNPVNHGESTGATKHKVRVGDVFKVKGGGVSQDEHWKVVVAAGADGEGMKVQNLDWQGKPSGPTYPVNPGAFAAFLKDSKAEPETKFKGV